METSKRFRILHLAASLQGGAAHHVYHLAKSLNQAGHEIGIAACCDSPSLQNRIESDIGPIHNIPLDSSFPVEALFSLRTCIEQYEWTHVHAHGLRAALLARLALVTVRQPPAMIYTVHGYHPSYYVSRISTKWINALERCLCPLTDAYICVSKSTQKDVVHAIPDAASKCVVIENAIPIPAMLKDERKPMSRQTRNQFRIPKTAFVIGTVARLQWQKSVDRLIWAFHLLREQMPDAYLFMVGDGPEKDSLKNLVASLQLGDRCIFTGHVADSWNLYPVMDLFVLPSLWEGLPLTILEAWASGVPVIATNVPGSNDIIQHDVNGYLADNTIEGIMQAIRRVRDDWNAIGDMIQCAYETISIRFPLERMVKQTLQVYSQTVRM